MPFDIIGLLVAILCGAAVGVERQRSGHASGPDARLGGIRTFTLLGTLAGISGGLILHGDPLASAALLAGAVVLTAAGYVRASRHDVDATTEVAALVVLGAGVLAGLGELRLAAGLTTFTVLLLVEKTRLHSFVRRLDDVTLLATVRFAVMSIIILPLLPVGPMGPAPGIRPRELWILVLMFSGLSFVGFIAQSLAGSAGYAIAGSLGGIISSTSVTLSFSRLSVTHKSQAAALATGVVAACTILFLRVAIAVSVLNIALLRPLVWWLVPPFLCGVGAVLLAWRFVGPAVTAKQALKNPLQFRSAIEMAALFQVVIVGVHFVREWIGEGGLLASAAVLGLTDVDALTLAMTRSVSSGTSLEAAARAIAVGILANTLLKAGVAVSLGSRPFAWRVAASLAAIAVPIVVMLAIGL